ncbi:DNA-binding transcriptional LysR family regulator [Serratia fonticola]|jgi:DNA-binding transcriptional LysR family regulator|uniref:DNA-binding transcriptional LysR family regulator n=1 Tax=Serratia fonticola TaxID=47917 RepID=A0A542BRW2_SERFO|nr:LysR family transcriptional regulator [Serratia fonticola]TQI81237.1 DNA-binding transcriptional LysR family regulator [Serratia fonticola]TQI96739.1 DNA-binding transcriptional LysR family regulator [Serratia fonticola]TVZ71235.1 DNA-binding transcriptional LysR family regulator [Serratia fonticola]
MGVINYNGLAVFIVVARERSFTRAAANLGISQSAVSHSINALEESLGMRLLTRTTRGAAPTEAGERLLSNLVPYYAGIAAELSALTALREKPAGTVRISAHDHAATTILWPKLAPLLRDYPDITIEISIDYGLIDIVSERFDAGVRNGNQIANDMIAMRISPDYRMLVVGSPDYFHRHPVPQTPHELISHNCANLRLSTHGGLYAWEFEKEGKALNVQVSGQMIFNTSPQMLTAALEGYALAFAPEDVVKPYVDTGKLVTVLEDWSPKSPGYHLYYPSRRHALPAFQRVLDALRYQSL